MKIARLADGTFHLALTKLMSQPVPVRAAVKLRSIAARARAAAARFEEMRRDGLQKYGSKTESGELELNEDATVKFTQEALQQFAKELNELGETDVDVGRVAASELGERIFLSGDDATALDGLLVE
jgi:hypothetical protein